MPSGAKKRKAAKKKKEKEAAQHHQHHHRQPHSADVHAHGDNDLKHHDDDSDAEDVSSPASQEHLHNHHQEEVEKTENRTDVRSSSEENKSSGGPKEDNEATETESMEERDIEIEQELEPADAEFDSKNKIGEDFETQKEASGGVLLQGMDKESVVQNETDSQPASDEVSSNSQIVENVEPKEGNDGVLLQTLDDGSVVQNETESRPGIVELKSKTAIVENVEPQKEGKDEVLLQSKEERSIVHTETDAKSANVELNNKSAIMENIKPQKEATHGAVLHSLDQGGVAQIEADLKTMDGPESKNVSVELAVPLKESTDGDLLPSQNEEPHLIDKKIVLMDNTQFVNSIQEANSFSQGLSQLTNSIEDGDHHSSSVEIKSADRIEKIKMSDEKIYGNTSVSADGNWKMKENGEKEAILQEMNGRTPPTCVDLGPYNRGNEAFDERDEIVATSDAKISAAREIGEKLTVSCNVAVTKTANGADSSNSRDYVEHLKDPEVPISSDCQPLAPSAPQVVKRTSWMNCCGLFEVFVGSDR